jgi:glycosyltransferase involved in cell wall biosynthesis
LGYRRRLAEMLLDVVLVSAAYYGAHRLMFTATEWADNFDDFFKSFPIVLGIQMLALFVVGAYRGIWRYFSLNDGVTFAKGVFLGVVTSQVAVLYLRPLDRHPPALFTLYATLVFLFLVASRASFRLVSEYIQRQRQAGLRLLIYGANDEGATAVRHLTTDSRSRYRIIGFVDDDVNKRNVRLHGYRVIGGYDHLVGMVMAGEVDVVAVTHDNPATAALASVCASHGVTVYRLGLDWREVRAAGVVAAGGAIAVPQAEPRVVRFPELRRPDTTGATSTSIKKIEPFATGEAPRPVRVAHIITRLILGGAQENTLYTAIGQHRDPRFDVTLICGVDEAGEGNMFVEANRAGVRTVVLPTLLREIRPLTDLKALVRLYLILRNGSFDLVHTHSSKAGIVGRIAARLAGVPVVVHTIHGVAFHDFQSAWKNNLYVALERLCAPLSDRIISVSQRLGEAAIARHIGGAGQHLTIFSGIELDLFLSVRERLTVEQAKVRAGIPPDAPVVGKIARMFPLKGHAQFLEAAALIAREVPGAYFLLVGDGPLRDDLRRDAETLGIGNRLVMVGRVPPDMVPDYMQAMDVVVHTSLREGIARVLPQAGAVGKPVVTFDLDGAPEVVRDGVSGYLVPPLDTGAIARRVTELLRDETRRRTCGEAGRAFAAEHFSVERMVERINALYLELVPRTFV